MTFDPNFPTGCYTLIQSEFYVLLACEIVSEGT